MIGGLNPRHVATISSTMSVPLIGNEGASEISRDHESLVTDSAIFVTATLVRGRYFSRTMQFPHQWLVALHSRADGVMQAGPNDSHGSPDRQLLVYLSSKWIEGIIPSFYGTLSNHLIYRLLVRWLLCYCWRCFTVRWVIWTKLHKCLEKRKHSRCLLKFEVFTAVPMKNAVPLDVKLCATCKNWRFRGTYRLHYQDVTVATYC
jgi:hypothetical protein